MAYTTTKVTRGKCDRCGRTWSLGTMYPPKSIGLSIPVGHPDYERGSHLDFCSTRCLEQHVGSMEHYDLIAAGIGF